MTPHTPYSYPDYDYQSIIKIKLLVIIKNKCVECVDYNLTFVFNKNFNTLILFIAVYGVCCCVYSLNANRLTPLLMIRGPICVVNGPNKTFKIHFNSCLKSSRRNILFCFAFLKIISKNLLQSCINKIDKNQVRLINLKTICFNLAHLIESRMA
jgi:hypothetical protein